MTKEEEKKKIEDEIVKAQDKLSDTMTAINRERLVLEDLKKDVKNAGKDFSDLETKISNAEQAIKDTQAKLDELKKKQKEAISKYEADKLSLSTELDNIRAEIKSGNLALQRNSKEHQAKLAEITQEHEDERKTIKDKIDLATTELDLLKKEYTGLKAKHTDLQSEYNQLTQKIAELEADVKTYTEEVKKLDKEIGTKNKVLEGLDKSIKSWTTKLEEINIRVKTAQTIETELNRTNEALKVEVAGQDAEKAEFIKGKFQLQKDREDLDRREEFIKNKYQQAGVKY